MTAFYMFRLLWLTFYGKFRGTDHQQHHLHESPPVMTIPLIILAVLAAFGGLLNIPEIFGGSSRLAGFLAPVFADGLARMPEHQPASHATEWLLMAVTLVSVCIMIAWSYHRFVTRAGVPQPDRAPRKFIPNLIGNKYYIDELYEIVFIRPVLWFSSKLHDKVEIKIIDRAVNGLGNLVVWSGHTLRFIQNGNVGFYMFIMIIGVILILFFNILI
jgi:NADH-quinone oxidoreductase subunit L